MASTASTDAALATLRTTLSNLSTLLTQLHSALDAPPTTAPTSKTNPLLLLHTSATLLREQTTKLSLLALNKPFTPTALTTALSLYARILPSLVSAVQLLAPGASQDSQSDAAQARAQPYPGFFHAAVKSRVATALSALAALLNEVPKSEQEAAQTGTEAVAGSKEEGDGSKHSRSAQTLRGTGVVWEECDWLAETAAQGVAALAAGKIRGWGELVVDALGEVEEWIDEGVGEADELGADELADDMEGLEVGGSSSGGSVFGGEGGFREELRPLAEEVVETLRLVKLVFPPLLKRRVGRFPRVDKDGLGGDGGNEGVNGALSEDMCERLHWMVERCRELSEETDEVVAALYAGNQEETRDWLKEVREMAIACVEGARLTWEGGEDEFSAWTGKWAIKLTDTLARFVMPRGNPNP